MQMYVHVWKWCHFPLYFILVLFFFEVFTFDVANIICILRFVTSNALTFEFIVQRKQLAITLLLPGDN